MEQNKEKNASWLSVPQFGDWDQKGPLPDYSMDFTKIREMRKQNKTNVSRASLGNEEELTASTTDSINTGHNERQHTHYHQTNSPTVRFLHTFVILYSLENATALEVGVSNIILYSFFLFDSLIV